MRNGVLFSDVDQLLIMVIPDGALGTDQNCHAGAVGAELQAACEKLFGRRRVVDVTAGIGSPHGKIDGPAAQPSLDGNSKATKRGACVTVPDGCIFPGGVIGVARKDEIIL